jgi:hypothetical protein
VGEKTRKAPSPPPEEPEERGEEARKGVGEEFRWERERERERDGEESAWRERKEGRIKNERGDFECE